MPFQFIDDICLPHPKLCPDLKARTLIATKTKAQLLFYLFFLTVALSDLIRGKVPILAQSVRIFQTCCLMVTLLMCCRSHLHIYYTIITLIISFGTMIVTMTGEVLYSIGAGFFGLIIIYVITDKWYYTSFTALVHLYNYQFILKEQMEIAILKLGAQDFCNKLIDICSFQLIMSMLMLCSLHQALQKTNQELWESKVKAEGSLSHYKTFLFSFSHEIRNPINILLGSLEVALQEYLPNSALDMIQTAKISGELLLQLINNVLDVGKAEVEKLEIVPTSTRIHDLLIRMWNICSEMIKKKKLSGYLKISTKLPKTLELDPDRTNQILLNLMGNAIKFTDRGSVNLTIEWLPNVKTVSDACFLPLPFDKDEEGIFDKNESFSTLGYSTGYLNDFYVMTHLQRKARRDIKLTPISGEYGVLKIIVRDQGCGMSSEAMKGLFKKFYQCSPEASQRKRGTGLGLYITKDIVESMGGQVRAFSEENRGSVFVACFLCKKVSDQY